MSVQVEITEVNGNGDRFTLDADGFRLVRHESVEKDFVDEHALKRVYYPEIEQLLLKEM